MPTWAVWISSIIGAVGFAAYVAWMGYYIAGDSWENLPHNNPDKAAHYTRLKLRSVAVCALCWVIALAIVVVTG